MAAHEPEALSADPERADDVDVEQRLVRALGVLLVISHRGGSGAGAGDEDIQALPPLLELREAARYGFIAAEVQEMAGCPVPPPGDDAIRHVDAMMVGQGDVCPVVKEDLGSGLA